MPTSGHAGELPSLPFYVVVDATGAVYLDGKKVNAFELKASLSGRELTQSIALQADRKLPARSLDVVLFALRDAGFKTIKLYADASVGAI